MNAMSSQITDVSSVYSNACSGADQRKYQSSASLAFVMVIHRWITRTKGRWGGKCVNSVSIVCVYSLTTVQQRVENAHEFVTYFKTYFRGLAKHGLNDGRTNTDFALLM